MAIRSVLIHTLLIAWCCSGALATEYHVSTEGDDANDGTAESPFRTIQKAADVMGPGDTCLVAGGVYRETVRIERSGEPGRPIRFSARPGEKAAIEGTERIDGDWHVHKGAIYRVHTDREFAQLFVDGEMMVEARWPNLRFPEGLWDRTTWARAGKGSRYGRMVDPELAKTGVDWTGARATLNVAHQFFSWTRTVARHAAGEDAFEYAKGLQGITHYADKTRPWEDDRYFLSGKLEALDAPGEWFLDTDAHTLYLWAPEGADPAAHEVEAKVRNYGFEVRNREYIEIAGFHFFAATFVLEDCEHCTVENCHLLYPTYARRISDPEQEPWADKTLVSGAHNAVRRCSLAYSPTSGLLMTGPHNVAEDNLLRDMGWYGSLRDVPLRLNAPGDEAADAGGLVRHNTVHSFGNAGLCFNGRNCVVEYNHVYNGGLFCEDVSLIYTQLPTCAGSVIRYNWAHGCRTYSGKGLGIRGDDQTRRLAVHHNVVWDCGMNGIIVKGDFNQVCNNTVLDVGTKEKPGNYIAMHARPEPKKPWRKQYPLLERQNASSAIVNNAALTITSDNRGTPFPEGDNVACNHQEIDLGLVYPANRDFRPRADSPLVDAGREVAGVTAGFEGSAPDVGAYEHGAAPWKPGITWTPESE